MARRIGAIVAGGLALALNAAPGAFTAPGACTPGPNRDKGWEVVLTHARTQSKAKATLALVQKQSRAKGLKAAIERDGCPNYEVAITGFRTIGQAAAAQQQSKAGFPHASIEQT